MAKKSLLKLSWYNEKLTIILIILAVNRIEMNFFVLEFQNEVSYKKSNQKLKNATKFEEKPEQTNRTTQIYIGYIYKPYFRYKRILY